MVRKRSWELPLLCMRMQCCWKRVEGWSCCRYQRGNCWEISRGRRSSCWRKWGWIGTQKLKGSRNLTKWRGAGGRSRSSFSCCLCWSDSWKQLTHFNVRNYWFKRFVSINYLSLDWSYYAICSWSCILQDLL